MSEISTSPQTGQRRKALWFTITPIVLMLAFFGAVAWKQHYFAASDRLYAFADSSAGIVTGMPVKIQGFAVGTVRDLVLVPPEDGKSPRVRIALDVNRQYFGYIGKEAVLRLNREGLIGQPVLDLIHGDPRARRAADGDVLAFERPRTLNEIAEDLHARAGPLLGDLKDMAKQLKDPDGDLMHTLKTARQIVSNVDQTTRAVGSLARTSEGLVVKSGGEATRALASAARVMARAEEAMPKLEGVLDHAVGASKSVDQAAQKADAVVASVLETVKGANGAVHKAEGLIDAGERLADDAGQIVGGAKRAWPMRLLAGPEKPQTLNVDSQDNSKTFIVPRAKQEKP